MPINSCPSVCSLSVSLCAVSILFHCSVHFGNARIEGVMSDWLRRWDDDTYQNSRISMHHHVRSRGLLRPPEDLVPRLSFQAPALESKTFLCPSYAFFSTGAAKAFCVDRQSLLQGRLERRVLLFHRGTRTGRTRLDFFPKCCICCLHLLSKRKKLGIANSTFLTHFNKYGRTTMVKHEFQTGEDFLWDWRRLWTKSLSIQAVVQTSHWARCHQQTRYRLVRPEVCTEWRS